LLGGGRTSSRIRKILRLRCNAILLLRRHKNLQHQIGPVLENRSVQVHRMVVQSALTRDREACCLLAGGRTLAVGTVPVHRMAVQPLRRPQRLNLLVDQRSPSGHAPRPPPTRGAGPGSLSDHWREKGETETRAGMETNRGVGRAVRMHTLVANRSNETADPTVA